MSLNCYLIKPLFYFFLEVLPVDPVAPIRTTITTHASEKYK